MPRRNHGFCGLFPEPIVDEYSAVVVIVAPIVADSKSSTSAQDDEEGRVIIVSPIVSPGDSCGDGYTFQPINSHLLDYD